MSIAGKRSSQGDEYQLRIGLWFFVQLLFETNSYSWVSMEVIASEESGLIQQVDDIQVGLENGSILCIQAKKNQKDYKFWTISNLKDELLKAKDQLEQGEQYSVAFYSRTTFGPFNKLLETAQQYPNVKSFQSEIGNEVRKTFEELQALFQTTAEQAFQFFNRISIGSHHSYEQWLEEINKDLSRLGLLPEQARPILKELLYCMSSNLLGHKRQKVKRYFLLNQQAEWPADLGGVIPCL